MPHIRHIYAVPLVVIRIYPVDIDNQILDAFTEMMLGKPLVNFFLCQLEQKPLHGNIALRNQTDGTEAGQQRRT